MGVYTDICALMHELNAFIYTYQSPRSLVKMVSAPAFTLQAQPAHGRLPPPPIMPPLPPAHSANCADITPHRARWYSLPPHHTLATHGVTTRHDQATHTRTRTRERERKRKREREREREKMLRERKRDRERERKQERERENERDREREREGGRERKRERESERAVTRMNSECFRIEPVLQR